ncbi:MAG TPA: zf-HC2 domain-containing protein [Thermoanaerobaculia bacterium]
MTDEPIDPELDRLLGLLAEEERGEPDPVEHPGAATLSSYHARTLPPGEVSRVQEHLVACRQCRDQLLEYARFMGPASEETAGDVASFERAAEWRRLKERMREAEAAAPEPLPVKAADDRRRILRSLRTFQALAAALGALAIGLFLRDAYVQGRARVLPEQSIYFGATRSVQESKPTRVRPPVALRITPDADYPRYRVEIETASGQPKQTLEVAPDGLIEIPDGWSPGTYKIRVLGLKDGRAEPVGRAKELVVVR